MSTILRFSGANALRLFVRQPNTKTALNRMPSDGSAKRPCIRQRPRLRFL